MIFRFNYVDSLLILSLIIFGIFIDVSPIILLPLFIFLSLFSYLNNLHYNQAKILFTSICLDSDILPILFSLFLFIIVFIDIVIKNRKYYLITKSKSRNIILLLFIYSILIYIISQVYELNLLSFPLFFLTFFSFTSVVFYYSLYKCNLLRAHKIMVFISKLIILENIIMILFQLVRYAGMQIITNPLIMLGGSFSDGLKGTMASANYLGYLNCILIVFLFYDLLYKNKIISYFKYFLLIAFLLFSMVISGSRTELVALFISLFYSIIIAFIKQKKLLHIRKRIIFPIFILATLGIINLTPIFILGFDYAKALYIDGPWNHKYQYFTRSIDPNNKKIISYFFGTGPGTLGTRASNYRSYEAMYFEDKNQGRALKPFASKYSKEILTDLYQDKYAREANLRSAYMGNPFSSLISFYNEYGVIGFILLIYYFINILFRTQRIYTNPKVSYLYRKLSYTVSALIPIILIVSIAFNNFEIGSVIVPFWLLVSLID